MQVVTTDSMITNAMVDHIINYTLMNGGGTFSYSGHVLMPLDIDEYILSINDGRGKEIDITYGINPSEVMVWMVNNEPFMQQNTTRYWGTWIDNNTLYLDIVIGVCDVNLAMEWAYEHNQRAIYNLTTGQTIYVALKENTNE